MADSKFKTRVKAQAGVQLPAEAVSRALTVDSSGDIKSSSVTTTELGYLSGVTSPIQTQITNTSNGLSDHLTDATDAHDASAISNIPSGNLAATDIQAAVNELQSDIDTRATQIALNDHITDTSDAHDASAISSVPAGNLAATDVQAALDELQSDVDTRALDSAVIKKDGSVAFTAAQSMGGFQLTGLAAGSASSHAINKGQFDAALEGLRPKTAVRVATTANITIATALNSGDSIDGVTLANGDRVLVKDQTAAEENGIYVVSATPTRSTDFDSLSPIDEINGSLVAVQQGTANAGKVFVQSGVVAVLDTDPINFVFFNSSASLVGGDGITVSGSNISVDHDGEGLTFVATQLALELDGSTLSKSAAGLKVNSITASQVSDFDEAAQDAVGGILLDSSKIDFTYSDATPSITATIVAGSLVNADINAAAAIDATKLGNGDVDNTELSYLNGVTSSIQTQFTGKASTTLNNLGTTSINANLLPDATNTRNLGSAGLKWANVNGTTGYFEQINLTLGQIDSTTPRTAPSGIGASEVTIYAPNQTADIGIYGGDPTGANGGSVFVETFNRTGANTSGLLNLQTGTTVNGNSGVINLTTGIPSGTGNRADINLDARSVVVRAGSEVRFNNTANTFYTALKAGANSANLSLTLPIADGTNGQVLQTNGSGVLTFVTPAAGYTDEQAQDAVGTILVDSATIDFTYDDGTPSITAIVIDGSITNAKVASGIDAVKIADGSVSNAEFQFLDGATSNIQTQLNNKVTTQAGDISLTSFAAADNQASPANVTGFAFANASVRSFKALVSVTLDATADSFESFELLGVQKGASWDLSQSAVGDDSGVVFSITNAGQIQYTSPSSAGFASLTIKFRAIVTTV